MDWIIEMVETSSDVFIGITVWVITQSQLSTPSIFFIRACFN